MDSVLKAGLVSVVANLAIYLSYVATVNCFEIGSVELVASHKPYEGLVEICDKNAPSKCGFVCNAGISNFSLTAICRHLEYGKGRLYEANYNHQKVLPFVVKNLACPETARSIHDCTYQLSDRANCESNTPLGIYCSGWCPSQYHHCENRRCVPRYWLCDGEDDCGDNSDEEESMCQQLKGTGKHRESSVTSSNGLVGSIKLVDGENLYEGHLVVCQQNATDKCGYVCSQNIDSRVGNVVCNQLGFGNIKNIKLDAKVPQELENMSRVLGEISCTGKEAGLNECRLRNWDVTEGCNDHGVARILCQGWCPSHQFSCQNWQCVPEDWRCDGVDDCGDGSDEVQCSTTPPVTSSTTPTPSTSLSPSSTSPPHTPTSWSSQTLALDGVYDIRLVDGRSDTEGSVLVCHPARPDDCGYLCDVDFDRVLGDLVCRRLGAGGLEKLNFNNFFRSSPHLGVALVEQACPPDISPVECLVTLWRSSAASCGMNQIAGVTCREPKATIAGSPQVIMIVVFSLVLLTASIVLAVVLRKYRRYIMERFIKGKRFSNFSNHFVYGETTVNCGGPGKKSVFISAGDETKKSFIHFDHNEDVEDGSCEQENVS